MRQSGVTTTTGGFRRAAGEARLAQPRALLQRRRRAPQRLQPAQPLAQILGHGLGVGQLALGRRQQELRLEVGEPGRHHEIFGRDLQLAGLHAVQIGQELLGQRQDRDLGEIDLVGAGEVQQQVERPLEPVQVDDEGVLGAGRRSCRTSR